MCQYAFAEVTNKDSSVELYLLNNWIKEFSLRDLIDRVSLSSIQNDKYFTILLKWIMNYRLSGNSDEKWAIEDFRKMALLLAKNIKEDLVYDFFEIAV